MPREVKKYLFDIRQSCERIGRFVQDKTLEQYQEDLLLRSGVERQLEIIGEALNQLSKINPSTAARISDYQRIIAFRNVLIHGYSSIADQRVWDIVQDRLPVLYQEVEALLGQA